MLRLCPSSSRLEYHISSSHHHTMDYAISIQPNYRGPLAFHFEACYISSAVQAIAVVIWQCVRSLVWHAMCIGKLSWEPVPAPTGGETEKRKLSTPKLLSGNCNTMKWHEPPCDRRAGPLASNQVADKNNRLQIIPVAMVIEISVRSSLTMNYTRVKRGSCTEHKTKTK